MSGVEIEQGDDHLRTEVLNADAVFAPAGGRRRLAAQQDEGIGNVSGFRDDSFVRETPQGLLGREAPIEPQPGGRRGLIGFDDPPQGGFIEYRSPALKQPSGVRALCLFSPGWLRAAFAGRQPPQNSVDETGGAAAGGGLDQFDALRDRCPIGDAVEETHLIAGDAQSRAYFGVEPGNGPLRHGFDEGVNRTLPTKTAEYDLMGEGAVTLGQVLDARMGVQQFGGERAFGFDAQQNQEGSPPSG